jgi:outer membrane immunogenic protein
MIMKKLALTRSIVNSSFATAVLIAWSLSAQAADMPPPVFKVEPPPAAFSWTGFYLGAGIGMRSADVDTSVASATLGAGSNAFINLLASPSCDSPGVFGAQPGPCPPNGASLDNTAFRVGPYLGYSWEVGSQWVVGIEGDWAWANASKSLVGSWYPGGVLGLITNANNSSFSVTTGWDASIRERVGFLVTPNFLVYTTGGAAWLHEEATSSCPTTVNAACQPGAASPAVITNTTTRLGWTVGGGLEAHLWGNWLVRGEYRYSDYGTWQNTDTRIFAAGSFPLTVGYGVRVTTNTATVGLAYKFDWPR